MGNEWIYETFKTKLEMYEYFPLVKMTRSSQQVNYEAVNDK